MRIKTTFFIIISLLFLGMFSVMDNALAKNVYGELKKNVPVTEEALVVVNIPLDDIRQEVKNNLIKEGSPIKKLTRFDMDPVNRLVILAGEIELPASTFDSIKEQSDGLAEISKSFNFNVSFKLPTAKKLAFTRYMQLEFVSLKLDGVEYISALPIFTRIASIIMANSNLVNFFLDKNIQGKNELSKNDINLRIRQFIENKNIRFRDKTVSFKLDLAQFADTKRFAFMEHLRLWQFCPILFKGTKDEIYFRLEAGKGKPSGKWLKDLKNRNENDKQTLTSVREEFYSKNSDTNVLIKELRSYFEAFKKQINLPKTTKRADAEISGFFRRIGVKAFSALNKKNEIFTADPEQAWFDFQKSAEEQINYFLTDMKRRLISETNRKNGGNVSTDNPFLEKRLSQAALSQSIRYFRDIKINGQNLFGEINLILAPQLPGLIVRGTVNIDLGFLFKMADENADIDIDSIPASVYGSKFGKGIPFELSLRIEMFDNGQLGIDVKQISLLGKPRLYFSHEQGTGKFLIDFTKIMIAKTMASQIIDMYENQNETPVELSARREKEHQELIKNIENQISLYGNLDKTSLAALLKLTKIDIESNPFIQKGREYVETKAKQIFKDLVKYDQQSGLLIFKLDPAAFSPKIMESKNTVQVWNIEPVYDSIMDSTFIDIAIGSGVRSNNYVKNIFARKEYIDSEIFTNTGDDEGPVDMHTKMNLEYFNKFLNKILTDAYNKQNEDVRRQMEEQIEKSSYLVKDANIQVKKNNVMHVNATFTHLKKSKRGWYNPVRWIRGEWPKNIKMKSISMSAEMGISVDRLSKYLDGLNLAENEVFWGEEVLKIDLQKAHFTMKGDTSIFDQIVNLAAGDIDFTTSTIGRKLKVVILRALGDYLNPTNPKENGNATLGGIKINRYAKLFTHKHEILIQINPRMAGPAFEMNLVPNGEWNGRKVGLILDKDQNYLSFDFKIDGTVAAIDKVRLLEIMKDAQIMLDDCIKINSGEKLLKILNEKSLFDKLFYNSDIARPSLMHKFKAVVYLYNGLVDIQGSDILYINSIYENVGINPGEISKKGVKRITATGVELMYFLAPAVMINLKLGQLVEKIKSFGIQDKVQYFKDFEKEHADLANRIINPILEKYESDYAEQNQKIVNKGPTDWNFAFFPDALFANKAYKVISKNYK
ncbi:MAG: hypothetical protein KAQ98_04885 [Bacteriovoracaceae bacterium]|nr:hypothetical protein [Bacteriovoracaceae bacterium]